MADRGVEYRLLITRDKSNASTLKAFGKEVTGEFDRIDKRAAQSGETLTKRSKKATDAQAKDSQRITKSTERILGQKDKRITKSADHERKERNKVTVSILKGMEREAKEGQRLQQKREADERRANERIIRDRTRASERLWREAATPMEKYRRKLQELERLSRQGIGTERQRAAAARKAYGVMQRETEKVGGEASRLTQLIHGQTKALGAMALGLVGTRSILSAVQRVHGAYKEWNSYMKEMASTSSELTKNILRDLALAGDLAAGPRITKALETMPGVTREEGRQLYAGLRGALPEAPVERILGLTRATAPAAGLTGGEGLGGIGTLTGQLSRMVPGKTDQDVAELAYYMQQQSGNQMDKLMSDSFRLAMSVFTGAGVPAERALGYGAAGLRAGLRPQSMLAAMESATAPTKEILEKITDETEPGTARALRRFAQAPVPERLSLLQRDEATRLGLLPRKDALRLGTIDPAAIDAIVQGASAAQQGDYFAAESQRLLGTPGGAEQMESRRLTRLADQARIIEEPRAKRRERERQARERLLPEAGFFERAATIALHELGLETATITGVDKKGASGLDVAAQYNRLIGQAARGALTPSTRYDPTGSFKEMLYGRFLPTAEQLQPTGLTGEFANTFAVDDQRVQRLEAAAREAADQAGQDAEAAREQAAQVGNMLADRLDGVAAAIQHQPPASPTRDLQQRSPGIQTRRGGR
ncbi:MAG: hypothetical protein ABIP48_09770 [Planctomycetota bacterium]